MQRKDKGYMVFDLDADDEPFTKKMRTKVSNVSRKGKYTTNRDGVLMLPDTDKPPVTVTRKNNSDAKGTVTVDEDQIFSIIKAIEKFTISKPNTSDDIAEKFLNDPVARLRISDTEIATDAEHVAVVKHPSKRKCKTKNLCVIPAVKEPEESDPESKKRITAKYRNHQHGKSNCNIPGCFFRDVENSERYSGRNFNKNKNELVQRIYTVMNRTVFSNKMPERILVTWNKKMLRTAGSYSIGSRRSSLKCTKVEISLKVCDSADRVRDTLVHELCHAASWVLHGIREPHGAVWKSYARKSNMVHPELPLVTRCHNYKINYKIYYECVRCKFRIGRYTKSLDTERVMCAKCKGPLTMLPRTRKDGTPVRPHVRPFAKYVQKNYKIVQYQTPDLTHKEVMRALSQEFLAAKQMQNP